MSTKGELRGPKTERKAKVELKNRTKNGTKRAKISVLIHWSLSEASDQSTSIDINGHPSSHLYDWQQAALSVHLEACVRLHWLSSANFSILQLPLLSLRSAQWVRRRSFNTRLSPVKVLATRAIDRSTCIFTFNSLSHFVFFCIPRTVPRNAWNFKVKSSRSCGFLRKANLNWKLRSKFKVRGLK